MDIIPFMILVSIIIIPTLLTYCLLVKGKDETLKMFSNINMKKILLLVLVTTLLINMELLKMRLADLLKRT